MAGKLVQVQFHDETLLAIKDDRGQVWVSLRRCCEALGVVDHTQRRKLAAKPWACTTEMMVHDASGRVQQATMIHLDSLPMWLATIEPRKVRAEIRPKLIQFQKDAARVLAEHFFPKKDAPDDRDPLTAVLEAALEVRKRQLIAERMAAEAKEIAASAYTTSAAALAQAQCNHGYFAVIGFSKRLKMEMSEGQAAAHGRRLTKICGDRGIPVHQIAHAKHGYVNTYPESVLKEYFDNLAVTAG